MAASSGRDRSHPDAAFIEARQERLTAAYKNGDINAMLEYYVEDGLDVSDYGLMVENMDLPAFTKFLRSFMIAAGDTMTIAAGDTMTITTVSVTGDRYFTAWERRIGFNVVKETDLMPGVEAAGQRTEMMGVSLAWWEFGDAGDGGGKIFRERDYARTVGAAGTLE